MLVDGMTRTRTIGMTGELADTRDMSKPLLAALAGTRYR
jgi:hypothetical protein